MVEVEKASRLPGRPNYDERRSAQMPDETKRPLTDARKRANAKFKAAAYDRVELNLPRGKKDEIKTHAEQYQIEVGEIGKAGHSPAGSITGFISRAIDETMERDNAVAAFTAPSVEEGGAE